MKSVYLLSGFTPQLASIYQSLKSAGKKFEVPLLCTVLCLRTERPVDYCRGFIASTVILSFVHQHTLQVVFVSSDQDQAGFDDYFSQMPWLALPYNQRERKDNLSSQHGVSGIPSLVLLDRQGNVITTNGRSVVLSDPSGSWIGSAAAAQPTGTAAALGGR